MVQVALRWHRVAPARQPTPDAAWGTVDLATLPPDPSLAALLPPLLALREGVLPWRRSGAATVVVCADPSRAIRTLPQLEAALGPVRLARAEPEPLRSALSDLVGRPLATRAERRLPSPASCRSLRGGRLARWGLSGAALLLAAVLLAPLALLASLAMLAAATLLLSAALRLAALLTALRVESADQGAQVVPARLPIVSVLVPLYREPEIAGTILARIAALDYPRKCLDLCLILEDDDDLTRRAVASAELPAWVQVIVVPEGTIRTKPRALNYALPFARGSVIGIYDAEDLPAPDHLRRVAEVFARRGARTACLQGALDYFNSGRNWMARCFTLEYAAWFRVLLPGLERLGMALPLGGTTLFLRGLR
ncbi:Glycosyl transferase, group 2 family protein [Rubellimicrobium mesophilum DSM 19309]|uniref:Glycosyl transferase, group 2 family protein n=1 Tax=Rubellimicrobium mesophilum DSM 19309 TaxID=442562 RepID=A0A017HTV2_9RHOB|nr:glycosyltransferase [Rubellimicrobium mesophilum]EYD77770.1 Glycosyl transferase, group 2 family protein [Rubellimicrobium mesophilum DSM 19309]